MTTITKDCSQVQFFNPLGCQNLIRLIDFPSIRIQDLNNNARTDSAIIEEANRWLAVQGIRNVDPVAEVCPMRLAENVDLHEDDSFISVEGYMPWALFMVLGDSKSVKYAESPESHWMVANNKIFSISPGQYVWFDASENHAVFPAYQMDCVTIWWKHKDVA